MAASTADKFKKVGESTVTTLAAPGKALGATSINVGSTTNFPTTTGIIIAIRTVDTNGDLVAGTYSEYSATVASGTSLSIVATPVYGNDQIYAAGSTTQVYIPASATQQNTMIDGILTHSNQDGTLKANSVGSTQIADGAVTSSKIAGAAGTWTAAPALTWVSSDGPTTVLKATGVDVTQGFNEGVRVKLDQVQAIQNYWSFDASSADSKGGAIMADIGTGLSYASAGKFGNCLTLNGTNQALSITDSASFNTLGTASKPEFTIGCWVKSSNTGAAKLIYQSWSTNPTNQAGIQLLVTASNSVTFYTANNTGASTNSSIAGSTNVCDGNWHYVAVSWRNNYGQLYVDGKLDASGYMMSPAYGATNYVRIGAYKQAAAGESTWFNGQIDDLFIAAYALDEQTIKAKYDAATAQGTGDVTVNKKALCSVPATLSGSDTLITVYTGTDYAIGNSAITNPFYSPLKAPYGFPLKKEKWSLFGSFPNSLKSSPTASTTYGGNNAWTSGVQHKMTIPIGSWHITVQGSHHSDRAADGDNGGYAFFCSADTLRNFVPQVNIYEGKAGIKYTPFLLRGSITLDAKQDGYVSAAPWSGGQVACGIYTSSVLIESALL